MTDRDVVQRFAALVGKSESEPQRKKGKPGYKAVYRVRLTGAKAAGFLMTVYSMLGKRRKKQAAAALKKWRAVPSRMKRVEWPAERGEA